MRDSSKIHGLDSLMELLSSLGHLPRLLPLLYLFQMGILVVLGNLGSKFSSLEEPKLLANFGPELYSKGLLYGSALSVLF